MDNILTIYGMLALVHIFAQMILGHINHIYSTKKGRRRLFSEYYDKTVAIIVPVFNEDPILLEKCLRSLDQIIIDIYGIKKPKIYVVDDGSKNREDIQKVFDKFSDEPMYRFFHKENEGKRKAQVFAINKMKEESFYPEVVITIDSDTVILNNGLQNIVEEFRDRKVGAVSGQVLVINNHKNYLTELIGYRYWMAFNQERAAQSYFDVVMCCSGPFSAYRGEELFRLSNKYVNQEFLGKKCTYGDDRHLTNLFLEEGWKVIYSENAKALTNVPTTLKNYIKQQIRWNKSFYREMLWTLKSIQKHHWYLVYDLLMQFILPFLLMASLLNVLSKTIYDPTVLINYAYIVMIIALLRVSYGIFRTRDVGFIIFLMYGFFHVLVLIPVRLYSLITLSDGRWGTR